MTFIKLFYSDIDNIELKNYRCQFSGLRVFKSVIIVTVIEIIESYSDRINQTTGVTQ
jgi:hypothetical protein